jgi:hypothetical protein
MKKSFLNHLFESKNFPNPNQTTPKELSTEHNPIQDKLASNSNKYLNPF